MANYDAGHYFLTVMIPIDRDGFVEINGARRSLIDHTRHVLTTLPTAQQDYVSTASGLQSPFARVPGTHFAHFFIIDDTRYNGRRPSNPIYDLVFNVKMTNAQKVDRLPDAYLVFAVDFDAPDGSARSLRNYTDALWHHMGAELRMIYENCVGFADVRTASDFYIFVRRGQVTTSLPFNDYWAHEPPLPSPAPWMAAATIGILGLAIIAGVSGFWTASLWGLWGLTLLALLALNIAIVVRFGLRPFPAAPDSDIQSVLKAVYVQQMFTGFAIENLGKSGEDLQTAFDAFCETHAPGLVDGPSQPPGVLVSKWKSP